jgi:hypothetical protein
MFPEPHRDQCSRSFIGKWKFVCQNPLSETPGFLSMAYKFLFDIQENGQKISCQAPCYSLSATKPKPMLATPNSSSEAFLEYAAITSVWGFFNVFFATTFTDFQINGQKSVKD